MSQGCESQQKCGGRGRRLCCRRHRRPSAASSLLGSRPCVLFVWALLALLSSSSSLWSRTTTTRPFVFLVAAQSKKADKKEKKRLKRLLLKDLQRITSFPKTTAKHVMTHLSLLARRANPAGDGGGGVAAELQRVWRENYGIVTSPKKTLSAARCREIQWDLLSWANDEVLTQDAWAVDQNIQDMSFYITARNILQDLQGEQHDLEEILVRSRLWSVVASVFSEVSLICTDPVVGYETCPIEAVRGESLGNSNNDEKQVTFRIQVPETDPPVDIPICTTHDLDSSLCAAPASEEDEEMDRRGCLLQQMCQNPSCHLLVQCHAIFSDGVHQECLPSNTSDGPFRQCIVDSMSWSEFCTAQLSREFNIEATQGKGDSNGLPSGGVSRFSPNDE